MPDNYEYNLSNQPQQAAVPGRKRQFIIASRRMDSMMPPAFQPTPFEFVEQALRSSPEVEVVDRIGPKGLVGTLGDGMSGAPNVLVARMSGETAELLRQQSHHQLLIEPDQRIRLALLDALPDFVTCAAGPDSPAMVETISVTGHDGAPVRASEVYLFGAISSAKGVTGDHGEVTLTVAGENAQSLLGLYVKPKCDYWTYYQADPILETNRPTRISLRPLSESFAGFPKQPALGWGQRMMRLDQLPANYRGQGVRIALLDSGAATTHQDLQALKFGFDVVNKRTDPATWNQDAVSHGTHCAGIIAGAGNAGGMRGFAPEAEMHVCKLFPGGHASQLIDALEYCIEHQVDVASLSLSGCEPSEALEQQLLRAKRLGVACIAAAGNSGGAVEYPASSPQVLAVAALGKWGEFPADSYHARTAGLVDSAGFFSPRFTCFGPQIGLCAPGVAILSAVPPNNYAVWDGTSMAAAHVAGLAALALAHHPEFLTRFKLRNSARVDRLFQILAASALPAGSGDPWRTGFGLPDVPAALGLAIRPVAPQALWAFGSLGLYRPYSQPIVQAGVAW